MSRADFFTLEKKKVTIYSDFLTSFDRNPTTDNLAINTNENAVKRSVRNIVLTNTGERFYNSGKGSKIRGSLFDNLDPLNLEIVRLSITETIKKYEPRADPVHVEIVNPFQNMDRNTIQVRITFGIINIVSEPITTDIFIQKVR